MDFLAESTNLNNFIENLDAATVKEEIKWIPEHNSFRADLNAKASIRLTIVPNINRTKIVVNLVDGKKQFSSEYLPDDCKLQHAINELYSSIIVYDTDNTWFKNKEAQQNENI